MTNKIKTKTIVIIFLVIVSVDGIEPSTSVLSGQRSTTELHAHDIKHSTNQTKFYNSVRTLSALWRN